LNNIREIYDTVGKRAVMDYLESIDHEDELYEIEIWGYVKDTSKVQWKSSRTKFTKMYDDEVKRLIANGKMDYQKLGFLCHLMMYASFEGNVLMIDEKNNTYMTQKDMIDVTGISESTIKRYIKELIKEEILYEKKHPEDQRKRIYFINPNIFYKGKKINKNTKEYYKYKDKEDNSEQ
jgi:Fic family protein